jgi:septal ring factor EnvC (AmiA/AmiB activator)
MSSIKKLESLRSKLATQKANLQYNKKRKKELKSQLEELGIKEFSEIPKRIKALKKKAKVAEAKLDTLLEELEDELSHIQD